MGYGQVTESETWSYDSGLLPHGVYSSPFHEAGRKTGVWVTEEDRDQN
jgi:hypothetical protein